MIAAPRFLRAALAALVAVATTVVLSPLAHADIGESIDVTITSHSHPRLDLSDPELVVELGGTIINTSATRFRDVEVYFWRSKEPITTPAQLATALDSGPRTPLGDRLYQELDNFDPVSPGEFIDPGDRAQFVVRGTVAQLQLPTDDAVYLLGVHVRGFPDGSNVKQTVGRGRILTAATADPLQISPVVPLTTAPTQLADGDFLDESLLDQFRGDLGTLLEAAERPGATVLVDPSLLAEAEALGGTHVVAGEEVPGREAAADWAARVRALIDDGRALRLPYADAAVLRSIGEERLDQVLGWAESAVTDRAVARLPLAVDLGARATHADVDTLLDVGFQTVFADNAVDGGAGGLVATSPLVASGIGPGGRDTDVQRTTRRLAEELLADVPRVYMIRSVDDVARLGDLAHREAVAVETDSGPARMLQPVESPAPWVDLATQLDDLWSSADFLRDLTGTDISTLTGLIAAKASSAQFPDEAAALSWVHANPAAEIDADAVTISAAKQFVMGSRTNNFPVTITNGLPVEVTVRLVFDSASPQRIDVPPTEFVTVQPGENLTLSVAPSASSNSVVVVETQLETLGGRTFGAQVPIEITATDLGRVGWIIIVVSGAVVLGGTFLRIRAVRAENAKESSEQGQ